MTTDQARKALDLTAIALRLLDEIETGEWKSVKEIRTFARDGAVEIRSVLPLIGDETDARDSAS